MINNLPYFNSNTDLSIIVNPNNNMELIVSFTHFKDELNDITNENGPIVIPFTADTKYEKLIYITLLKNGRLVIDEPFNDSFYYESNVLDKVDKICWFSIPMNYNDAAGLNNIEIYAKGGVNNVTA